MYFFRIALPGGEEQTLQYALEDGQGMLKKVEEFKARGLHVTFAGREDALRHAVLQGEQAASMLLKGLTVHYLVFTTYPVKKGETVLWHAAAGGVGLIACQWLKALGVTTIGTAGSAEKLALAKAHGADHLINYSTEDWVKRVKEFTGGKGVPVVYDSVGKSTWEGSLDCLRPRGLIVSFGNASGAVAPVNLGILSTKGSLYVTRPTLATHIASRADLVERSNALFDIVSSGKVKIETTKKYKLADAAQAHRDLESRKTTGSVILTP